jgi:hypothetical protein
MAVENLRYADQRAFSEAFAHHDGIGKTRVTRELWAASALSR